MDKAVLIVDIALKAAGRRVIETQEVVSPHLFKRYEAAKVDLESRTGRHVCTHRLYHGTSSAAARSIAIQGFRIERTKRTGAFGTGVNLTPAVSHTLLYSPTVGCIVVCDVAISRMHINISREDVQNPEATTIPDHMRPKPGFDAMYGAGGKIIVVPCSARVLPRWLVFHSLQTV